jgi:phenylacetate-coenzyme A ligase PaaK-like adenylate-forming protein
MELNPLVFSYSLWSDLKRGRAELEALRLRRLRRLIEHAYENVGYYRKLFDSVGFRPRHLQSLADLSAIPVTTREKLQPVPLRELLTRGTDEKRLEKTSTSGSAGAPLNVYRTRREKLFRQLLTVRAFYYHGLKWNDRVVTISRAPATVLHSEWHRPIWARRKLNLSFFDPPEEQLQPFLSFAPTIVYGYAPSVALLADLVAQNGGIRPPVRLVATSAEILMPDYRTAIQKGFGVDSFEIYSCAELGNIGWQCAERKGFHVNADWLNVEIAKDGAVTAPGEPGEVIVTSLYRYAMPLIRYSPGDFASLDVQRCPCGLLLPGLARLEGRAQTLVALPNGRCFIGFARIMSEFPEVGRFQIVQRALDHFSVSVVRNDSSDNALLERIRAALVAKMGNDIHVEVRSAQPVELVQGPGKFRPVIPLPRSEMASSHSSGHIFVEPNE